MTGAFSTTSTKALAVATGINPLDIGLKRRAAEYWLRKGKAVKVDEKLDEPVNTKREIKQFKWQESWGNAATESRTHALISIVELQKHIGILEHVF